MDAYRAKRSAEGTPEPFGGAAPPTTGGARLFVVQKHAARRLHWDFRLELGGTLRSWAVPQGPSPDPDVKRLAVEVEDHPLEYADFEGIIPKGNYGAGEVIVWDRGAWVPLGDPEAGLERGKLYFELFGYKLRGVWQLVRTWRKGRDPKAAREWLLIKKRDAWARREGEAPYPEASVLSGRTLEELREGSRRGEAVRAELARLGARRHPVSASEVKVMLAEAREAAFSRPGWIFELKYDGFRLVVAREQGRAVLRYRSGLDATAAFPELATAVAALPYERIVLDGEVVVLDEAGRPSFQRLQRRLWSGEGVSREAGPGAWVGARVREGARVSAGAASDVRGVVRDAGARRRALELPATLFCFDLLGFEDYDLRDLPLRVRKELLRKLLPPVGPLRFADHVEERGVELFEAARGLGVEGIVGKKASSRYVGRRSHDWIKVRTYRTGDFAIVGFGPGERSRTGLGSLHLAGWDGRELVYVGRVGSGLRPDALLSLRREHERDVRATPPCRGPTPKGRQHVWVEPRRVCEVRYLESTNEGRLRHPVFLRIRDDKLPGECDFPVRWRNGAETEEFQMVSDPDPGSAREVPFSNLDKLFWPEDGYTKGDLIEYYGGIAPWILPYLRDRPVVMTRYPDGIHGKSFFQKDAPAFAPAWIRTVRLWSEHARREIDYFVCDDRESLLYLVNLGTIPLHVWASRVATIGRPDWCILDLDPKGAPWAHVIRVAVELRRLCDAIGLPSYPKTSGQEGLHVLIPLGGQCTFEEARTLGELLARVVVDELHDVATIARAIGNRRGRVYVDYLQNGHGKLLVAPFSVRPRPGAPVSMPLAWREVNARLDPARFTIRTALRRMERLGRDPMAPVLGEKPDLATALERLGERLRSAKPRRKA